MTGLFWVMRWQRSWAWRSCCGFQSLVVGGGSVSGSCWKDNGSSVVDTDAGEKER